MKNTFGDWGILFKDLYHIIGAALENCEKLDKWQ